MRQELISLVESLVLTSSEASMGKIFKVITGVTRTDTYNRVDKVTMNDVNLI